MGNPILAGLGFSLPKRQVSNHDLVGRINTSDEFIVERTGVRTRNHVAPVQAVSALMVPAARQAIAREVFTEASLQSQPHSYHLWLNLPELWRSDEFALLARANGVVVMSASQFQVERTGDPRGVRVVLMSPTSREELRFALTQLASLLESGDPKRFY